MKQRQVHKYVASLGVLIALAGCAPAERPAISEESWRTPASVTWTRSDLLMSEPLVVDDVVVAYAATLAGGEEIIARDAKTGSELWRAAAIPGTSPPGVAHQVAAVELDGSWTVAFLSPGVGESRDIWGTLQIVNARTGTSIAPGLSEMWLYGHRPGVCGGTYCIDARLDGGSVARNYTYTHDDGGSLSVSHRVESPYLDGGFFLGTYVSAGDNDGTTVIRYGVGGKFLWTRWYTDVFGEGTSTGGGWVWRDSDPEVPALGIGYGYQDMDFSQPFAIDRDLAQSKLVALDPSDGKTLWSIDRVHPCNATTRSLMVVEEVLVLCRYNSGVIRGRWTGSEAIDVVYADLDIDAIGIDPSTGEIIWELPLGSDPANVVPADFGEHPFRIGEMPIVALEGKAHTVNAQTGSTTEVPDDAALLCEDESRDVSLRGAWNGGELYDYPAPPTYGLCTSTGTLRGGTELSLATLQVAGFDTGSTTVLNMTSGVWAVAPTP